MSRVIKFRAWSESQNRFVIEDCTIGWLNSKEGSSDYPKEAFIWQEWTGLTDKNGKEVFEGDVLDDGGVVVWGEIESAFLVDDGLIRNHLWTYRIDEGNHFVIGNIWENPELLSV